MNAVEFFSEERFAAAGVKIPSNRAHILHLIRNSRDDVDGPPYYYLSPQVTTVGDLIKIKTRRFLKTLRFGRLSFSAMQRILQHEGFEITDKDDPD